jgi:small subunit ribosomal protein S8e
VSTVLLDVLFAIVSDSYRLLSLPLLFLGIARDSRHKRSASGAQRAYYRKKRKFELGRQPAGTKLGPKRVHTVRVRGGNLKHRALRLESGNFAWGSENITKKTRLIGVVSCFMSRSQ